AALKATGLPAIADDSGICVDALNGMPGVLSARWSGPSKDNHANNVLLLGQLEDVPDERRGASFVAAVAFVRPDGAGDIAEEIVLGEMRGSVIRELRGTGGFGYDVLFQAEGYDRTTAELSVDEKDAISHRGKALRTLAPIVAKALRS
ncbi:MAG TPA: non-canonical purine NTP pyrophosphatase, partial [Kribbella sp.]|nr:non-canonical purine NTP pyrophosphatase [Kribbella sp.]